ncbi:hypothetical protein VTJ49DRAFT_2695 [Mycothermus thermophilus]|uniref:Mid2 domain-containing protein n=1 Tax=Humicola insolens TaxID=85995 RepID=A0ABR3VAK6_HUMIN
MVRSGIVSTLLWGLAAASAVIPAPEVAMRVRNLPGTSDEYTYREIARRLNQVARREQETVFENSAEIYKSWEDALLFKQELNYDTNTTLGDLSLSLAVEVTCVSCYISADATAKLSINGDFDLSSTIHNVTEQLGDELSNLTKSTQDSIEAWARNIWHETTAGTLDSSDFSFDNFTIDNDFNIQIEELPDVTFEFTLAHLDVYALLDTTISASATLTIPLYKSQTPVGIWVGEQLELGVFVTVDLILSVDGSISLRSGFHIRVDEELGFELPMFSRDVSDVFFNGAKYEFLPVTVYSGNVVLKAVLRVGTHAGFTIDPGSLPGLKARDLDLSPVAIKEHDPRGLHDLESTPGAIHSKRALDLDLAIGIEVGIWTHLAELVTNITYGALAAADDAPSLDSPSSFTGPECLLRIVEAYTLAIGAAAGATVEFRNHTWGPQPDTSIPIFYTTLANVCAMTSKTASATPTPTSSSTNKRRSPAEPTPPATLAQRQADDDDLLKTTTLTTTTTMTGISCQDPALVGNCPVSLQTTSVRTEVKTLVTSWREGVDPVPSTIPEATATTKPATSEFGPDVKSIVATSGKPVSYVPPPPGVTGESEEDRDENGDGAFLEGETGGVSNRVWLGVGLGVGVPLLLGVVVGVGLYLRRKRYQKVPVSETKVVDVGPTEYQSGMWAEREGMLGKKPQDRVTEVRH